MSKEKLTLELQALERKIMLLLNDYTALKGELVHVKEENTELRRTLQNREDKINSFQNQIKISKIVDSIAVGKDKEDANQLKLTINGYIKEIDKCIAHLSE